MRKRSPVPADLDAKTIFSESLMDLRPWNYWMRDGEPYAETTEIQAALQQVLARHPKHPGARTLDSLVGADGYARGAERRKRSPVTAHAGAGTSCHIRRTSICVSATCRRVFTSNQMAVKADEDYIAQCRRRSCIRLGYTRKTSTSSAGSDGQRAEQGRNRRRTKSGCAIPAEHRTVPILQDSSSCVLGDVRFARWDDIMNDKGPRHDTAFTKGAWRFARAMALTATNRLSEASTSSPS